MLTASKPLKDEPDEYVNGYDINTETEEEKITPEQQEDIAKKIEAVVEKKDKYTLYYFALTDEEKKRLEKYLVNNTFNNWAFRNAIGEDKWIKILDQRLDDILKQVRTTDNSDIFSSLLPYDKYYYALIKKDEIDSGVDATDEIYNIIDTSKYEDIDQLVLQNTLEGYKAREESSNYFLGKSPSDREANEIAWIAEYLFATDIYPKKYGDGNELGLDTDKYIYNASYFGGWDFQDNTYAFEIKTRNKQKYPTPLYYCQKSKIDNIPNKKNKIAIWWGEVPSYKKTIESRTIEKWLFIEMDKNDIGPGKKYHFEDNGFYKDNDIIATYGYQGGLKYNQGVQDQLIFEYKDLTPYTL